ncbi:Cytidylate kinase [Usitatibacter rugosus]|uniref:Cytidylate kinase n=1 Tax=Usitatibacter rugosus TaxID=2732067 RepID=A0A6M4H3Q2_9PROT|nr:cytidylate kinase family protein [Usitatibacter rugosus]QJR12467.1 Cytidylate kinase [Usitatibacter rugosus]
MAVIAMTQEMATLGKDVALGVCEALGLQQVRHEVGDVVAGKMQVKKSLIRRIREGKAGTIEKWSADEKTISIFTADEVYDLALKGNVLIRGWGATLLLHSVPHIPCVQVCAPMDLRVKRLMERLQTDDEALARQEIKTDDAARAARMGEMFKIEWGDPTLYDLTLNTERVPIADCVDTVVRMAKSAAFQETPASRQKLADMALQARARAALRADDRTSDVEISIDVSGGRVALRGIVANDKERERVHAVIEGLAGVAGIDDELRTMAGGLYRFPSQLKDKG